jgi:inosine-uridine nucleoside N-ribohydrolase
MLRWLAAFLLAPTLLSAGRDLVVVDNDQGIFGDDGAALVMLLRTPQISVQSITVVSGNLWASQEPENVFHILDLMRRPSIPVCLGAEFPLLHTPEMAKESERRWGAISYNGAFGMPMPAASPAPPVIPGKLPAHRLRHDAVACLVSEIERHPGEVTVLELGPMTNLAMALRMKPAIETKIKRVVFMGGAFKVPGNSSPTAEFNFWFDPEAARIVLRSRIPQKIMFGLDICEQAPIRKHEFDQIAVAKTPIAALYREDFGNRYPGYLKHPDVVGYLWDALAAAYLIDPDFVTQFETRYLDVQSNWGQYYGATIPLDRRLAPAATPVQFMIGLDFKRVFALYKDKLTKAD